MVYTVIFKGFKFHTMQGFLQFRFWGTFTCILPMECVWMKTKFEHEDFTESKVTSKSAWLILHIISVLKCQCSQMSVHSVELYTLQTTLTHYHKLWMNHLAVQLPGGHHQKRTPRSGRHEEWRHVSTQHVVFYPTIGLSGHHSHLQKQLLMGGQRAPTTLLQHAHKGWTTKLKTKKKNYNHL